MFYVNALSATTFALYTTLANALADTSRVNLTSTTTGATMTVLVASNEFNIGFAGIGAVAGSPGGTSMAFDLNLSNALASAIGATNYSFTALTARGGTNRGSGFIDKHVLEHEPAFASDKRAAALSAFYATF